MKQRLPILRKEGIKLKEIQDVISKIKPLPGAKNFLDQLRSQSQVIILTDSYYEFVMPIAKSLGLPTILCNWLSVDPKGFISDYHLRQPNGKEKAVRALKSIGFKVKAAGDSYNDITMLKAADEGVLFNPPKNIIKEFPKLVVTRSYKELLHDLLKD